MRAELKELLEIEIPKTLKGINAAAAEGDLRENFEYHMIPDRQEQQSARAAKLQRELAVRRFEGDAGGGMVTERQELLKKVRRGLESREGVDSDDKDVAR